ncbi:hypothetical protein J6590_017292 [Homalodisca vitripennis]|nr:hypothetical protein J6590_017292 [Homalodisca vitripennis]
MIGSFQGNDLRLNFPTDDGLWTFANYPVLCKGSRIIAQEICRRRLRLFEKVGIFWVSPGIAVSRTLPLSPTGRAIPGTRDRSDSNCFISS